MLRDTLREVLNLWNLLPSLISAELCLLSWDTPKYIHILHFIVFGGKKGTAEGKFMSKNKLSYLCDLFLGVCLAYNKSNSHVANKSFLYSLSIHYVVINNMKYIMNNTDCCPIYPDSEAVNGGFSLEKKACFEVLDFLKDYQRFLICFY